MTKPFDIEFIIDRSLSKAAREAQTAELRALAQSAVAAAVRACPSLHRDQFVICFLQSAADVVAQRHDGPRVQACLGQVASRYGAEFLGRGAEHRRAADRLFRRGGNA